MTANARENLRDDRPAAAIATAVSSRSADDARALAADRASVQRPTAGLTSGATLVARSLSRSLRPLLAVCLVLMVLQIVLVLNASSQQEAQSFSRMAELMPAFLRRTLGELTLVMMSFQGVVSAGFFHPVFVLLVSVLSIYFGSEPAYDVEAGLVDLLLARAIRRHWLITRSLALILIGACAMPAVMAITMGVALHIFAPADAPWPPAVGVVKMAIGLAAVATVNGALSLFVASRARRRGTAITVAGVAAVLFYLLNFLEPTWAPAQTLGWISPFHYFHPLNVLSGRMEPWRDLLVLGSVTAAFAAAAYWQFDHRDL